jgi:branched-chain amino acid transport system substrate-binding protein
MDKERKQNELPETPAEEGLAKRTVSRRDFLKLAGVAGAAVGLGAGLGGIVAACGGSEETTTTAGATETTAAGTETTAAGTETTVAADAEAGREIKIGFVTPQTGPLASFGIPDKYCMDRASEAVKDGVIGGDGKKHAVTIVMQDSQSDSNRAAQVTGDLINNNKVDIVTAASTPDTVSPVADQCEALETPCITNDCPWEPYFVGRGAALTDTFKWTYHTFWGVEDAIANYTDMWKQVPTNNAVGVMWPNDADGNGWQPEWDLVWESLGLKPTIPSMFQDGTEDFTAQIAEFKKAGCELGVGIFIPPDFANFWKQCKQQGWSPKMASYAKPILFPDAVEAIGDIATNLTTEVWWHPTYPYTSALLGETCQQFADEFEKRNKSQWTPPLLHFIVFEMAVDVIKRATDMDDKEAIMAAIKTTKLDTIGGPIDFSAPVVGATRPYQVGPCHIVENVYKTPQCGGQWRKGTKYPFELALVSTAGCPDAGIKVQDKVQPLSA